MFSSVKIYGLDVNIELLLLFSYHLWLIFCYYTSFAAVIIYISYRKQCLQLLWSEGLHPETVDSEQFRTERKDSSAQINIPDGGQQ